MPRGPKGEKRPADVVSAAVMVVIEEREEAPKKRGPYRKRGDAEQISN
jgi:hypothetical protein